MWGIFMQHKDGDLLKRGWAFNTVPSWPLDQPPPPPTLAAWVTKREATSALKRAPSWPGYTFTVQKIGCVRHPDCFVNPDMGRLCEAPHRNKLPIGPAAIGTVCIGGSNHGARAEGDAMWTPGRHQVPGNPRTPSG